MANTHPFLWLPVGDNCCGCTPACPCEHCLSGTAPNCLEFTFAGLADSDCWCCGEMNDTFRGMYSNGCRYLGAFSQATGEHASCYGWFDMLVSESGGTWYVTVTAHEVTEYAYPNNHPGHPASAEAHIVWQKSYPSKPDCLNFSGESIPFQSQAGDTLCDASGSTVTIGLPAGVSQVCMDPCTHTDWRRLCGPCRHCKPDIEVTFPVFANHGCGDCGGLNAQGPFVLDAHSSTGYDDTFCAWELDVTALGICSGDYGFRLLRFTATDFGVNTALKLALVYDGFPGPPGLFTKTVNFWATVLTADWDCKTELQNVVLQCTAQNAVHRPCEFVGETITIDGVWP